MVIDVSAMLVARTTWQGVSLECASMAHLSCAFGCWLEDLALHLARKIRIDWRNDQLWHLVAQSVHCLFEILLCCLDLVLTSQEQQDITLWLSRVDLQDRRDRRVDVVCFGLLRVEHVDGETSSGNYCQLTSIHA